MIQIKVEPLESRNVHDALPTPKVLQLAGGDWYVNLEAYSVKQRPFRRILTHGSLVVFTFADLLFTGKWWCITVLHGSVQSLFLLLRPWPMSR